MPNGWKSGALVAVLLAWSCTNGVIDSRPPDKTPNGSGGSSNGKGGSAPNVGGQSNTAGSTSSGKGGNQNSGGSSPGSGGATSSGGSAGSITEPEAQPGPITATAQSIDGPSMWKNYAQAAYTIIHDDTCAFDMTSHYTVADPELTKRGLRAGFGTIAGMCAGAAEELRTYIGSAADNVPKAPQWDQLRTLLSHGHELVNHSWSHVLETDSKGFPAVDETRWKLEIDRGRDIIKQNIGVSPEYFIFPFDEKTDGHLWYLEGQSYVGARGGAREKNMGVNSVDFGDRFRVDFAVFYASNAERGDLNGVVDKAISEQGWGLREVHGIGGAGNGWEPVPTDKYLAHLDYVEQKSKAGEVWMDGPTAVTRYRFAREHCSAPTVSGNKLTFSSPSSECSKYATALSYKVQVTTTANELVAIQAKKYLVTKNLGSGTFLVHADPTQGDVSLSGR